MVDATTVLLVLVTILAAVLVWSRRTYFYWRRRRIKFVQPTHLLGNLKQVLRCETTFALQLRRFYADKRFEQEPLVGIYLFHQPALLVRDLELARIVLSEDFVSFADRFSSCDKTFDELGALNLFFAKRPEWREIRTKLAPVFSSAKLRRMFHLMQEVGVDLESYLHDLTHGTDSEIIEIKDVCDRYSTDMIASIAFGFRAYSLRNTEPEIGAHTHGMFDPQKHWWRAFGMCIIFFLPKFVKFLHPKLFSSAHAKYLRQTVTRVIQERDAKGIYRNDLIEMLLTLKKEAELNQDRSHFTHKRNYLAAQVATFEFAAIKVCSPALSFALYELAKRPEVQERLRAEINANFGCGEAITFENIAEMQYLSMVIDEILRMYPIVPYLERQCTPINKKRFYTFRPHAQCLARRGMPIYVSSLGIHYDPKLWPDPEFFDPERFSPEQKSSHKPMSYLPFGAGPRNCIGFHVAQLHIKMGLIYFLRKHRVEVCDKTVDNITFDPKFSLLSHDGGIFLRIIKSSF